MSDLKLWSQKNKSFNKLKTLNNKDIEKILIEHGEKLFELKILVTNYYFDQQKTDYINALALDSQKQLVLIEYRKGKYSQIIGRGLMHLDYISQNESQFKLLAKDLKIENSATIIYKPRLLVIGEDFSEYDYYAIRQLPYPIELIRMQADDEHIILHKHFVSQRTQTINFNPLKKDERLLTQLIEFVYSLGDEVVGLANGQNFTFRKILKFLEVEIMDELKLTYKLKNITKTTIIKTQTDLEKLESILEEVYNEG